MTLRMECTSQVRQDRVIKTLVKISLRILLTLLFIAFKHEVAIARYYQFQQCYPDSLIRGVMYLEMCVVFGRLRFDITVNLADQTQNLGRATLPKFSRI